MALVPATLMKGAGLGAAVFKGLRDRLKEVSDGLEDELEKQLEAQLEAELEAQLGGEEPTTPEETEPGPSEEIASEPEPPSVEEPAKDPEEAAQGPPEERPPQPTPAMEQETVGPTTETTQDRHVKEPEPRPITGRRHLSEEEVQARLEKELGEAVEVQKEVEEVAGATATGRFTINEQVLDEVLWDLEVALLESDVALPVIEAIKDNVKEQLLSMRVGGRSAHEVVEKVLRTAIKRVLAIGTMDFDGFIRERLDAGDKPVVVMFVGVNGTGKTTSIARMAYRLQQAGISSVMAAGDTFRAGAIEQLSQHGDRLGIRVVKHSAGADPAAVAYDAIEHAKARHKDVVLLDTAGRMQTNRNLMDEMDKIRRVAKPDLVVFVGDSLAGNDAVEQARRFDEVVDIDGAILTKTDVDAKGGAALSVAYTINKPLLFIGVGQDYADLEPFDADIMVSRLFGSEE